MSNEAVQFTTPVGRWVGGSIWLGSDKDDKGILYVYSSGASKGQPYSRFGFGLAIPKGPEWDAFHATLKSVAQRDWPQGQWQSPTFAWKITDGDSTVPNSAGNKPCDREGYKGHMVVWFSGTYAPQVYDQNVAVLTDPNSVKKGYYIRVAGSVSGNANAQKPGLYMNYSMVQLCGFGEEIVSGPDAKAAFGTPPVPVAGMSNMPSAPASVPAVPPTPAPTPAPPAPPAPKFSEGPRMAKDGQTVDAYLTAGWTEELMKQHGLID